VFYWYIQMYLFVYYRLFVLFFILHVLVFISRYVLFVEICFFIVLDFSVCFLFYIKMRNSNYLSTVLLKHLLLLLLLLLLISFVIIMQDIKLHNYFDSCDL